MCIYKFLVLAGTPKQSIFRILWQMGGSRCVQNTTTVCGTDVPALLGNHVSVNRCVLMLFPIDYHMCSPICYFLLCFRQSSTGKMTVLTVVSFHGFHGTSHFDMVFTSQIRVFHVRPTFSILGIVDIFLFVQHICIYVFSLSLYIYTYRTHIYIYVA